MGRATVMYLVPFFVYEIAENASKFLNSNF